MQSPAITFGRIRVFCSGDPNSATGKAPIANVGSNGIGATERPCCSSSMQSSKRPNPSPPWSSGIAMPRRLVLASSFHRFSSNFSSVFSISSTRSKDDEPSNIWELNCSNATCSSERSKFMVYRFPRLIPNPIHATISRWISFTPPPNVLI